ncbi:MAG: SAM-dependent methyltransferase [Acidimicrobiia bacterium]
MEPSPGRARADARGLLTHPPTGDPERRNRAFWDADADAYQAAHGEALTRAPMAWGVWRIPEAELGVLGDVRGLDVLEYGCGGAQWSVALAASGARAVGLDLSRTQLSHARRLVRQAAAGVALVCATATAAPFVDASFDLVFCDHGAMSFADPAATIPECARLLRDGGRLVFALSTQLRSLTWDPRRERVTRRLHTRWRPRWVDDTGEGTVDFVWSHGEWIRTLRAHGFEVDDLVELRAPKGATTTHFDYAPRRWARRWPGEEIWCVTRQSRVHRGR